MEKRAKCYQTHFNLLHIKSGVQIQKNKLLFLACLKRHQTHMDNYYNVIQKIKIIYVNTHFQTKYIHINNNIYVYACR